MSLGISLATNDINQPLADSFSRSSLLEARLCSTPNQQWADFVQGYLNQSKSHSLSSMVSATPMSGVCHASWTPE